MKVLPQTFSFFLPFPHALGTALCVRALTAVCGLLLGCLLACGCDSQDRKEILPGFAAQPAFPEGVPVYRLAVSPSANVKRVFASYLPLVEIVNARANGFAIRLVVPQDYADMGHRLYAGKFPLALADPAQANESLGRGYRVSALMGDGDSSRGLIILRNDSDIHTVTELAGSPLSFPAAASFTSTLLPKSFLHEWGLDLSSCPMRYVGSTASALMSVYYGKTAAAGIGLPQWETFRSEHPEIAANLKIGWVTEPFVTDALLVHQTMPPEHAAQVTEVLLHLHETPEGRAALAHIGLSRFEPGSDADYLPVAEFIRRNMAVFSQESLTPRPHR